MKAGGVQFADTPEEAAAHAEHVLGLEINGHSRAACWSTAGDVEQEYYAGRRLGRAPASSPVMIFSDMGGHRHRGGRRDHPDTSAARTSRHLRPSATTGQAGDRVRRRHRPRLNRLTPIVARSRELFVEHDMTLAEINPLAELEDGSFVALDAHMDMENEAAPRQKALLRELGVGDEETRQAREATPFELAGEAVDARTTAAWRATSPSSTATGAGIGAGAAR
jgi:succinyl-CoA synthetase beta subunit/citryl-CoA synthetase large subunit